LLPLFKPVSTRTAIFYKSAPLILRRRPFGQAFAFVCKFLELVWFFHARAHMSNSQPKGVRYGGRQKGTKNRATVLREQEVARAAESHAAENGFDLKSATDLEKLDWAALKFAEWLAQEQAKGEEASLDRMITLLREMRDTVAKTAAYRHPKLQVHRMLESPRSDGPLIVRLKAEGEPDQFFVNGKPTPEETARTLSGNWSKP
jgi:hypothetical protein